jgi:membrane protein YqaA with SNARE-associated domain
MGLIWIAATALWAVAEATVFFIVPDVLLTAAAIKFGLRRALLLSLLAAGAASLAGLAMWTWGARDAEGARHVMLMVPAIGPDLLQRAQSGVAQQWFLHLVTGAMTGVPYKLYAVEAGAIAINPWLFVPASFAARFLRFFLTVAAMAAAKEVLSMMNRARWAYAAWAVAWLLVYGTYFTIRANG